MRVRGGVRDLPDDLPRRRVGEVEVDRKEIARREEDDPGSVGAQLRADVYAPFVRLIDDQRTRKRRRHLRRLGNRAVGGDGRVVPFLREVRGLDPEHALERALVTVAPDGDAHQRPDRLVAVAAADVSPQRLSVAIWEVLRVIEVVDLGQALAADRLAHPHRRIGIDGADRQVLRHPLDEP